MKRLILFFLIVFLSSFPHATASTRIHASFLSEKNALVAGQTNWILLRFEIDDGWHTYWRNPGDAGLPPEIHWSVPQDVTPGELLYPIPERIRFGDLTVFGYYDAVDFLIPITVASTERPSAVLSARVSWLVCETLCIPEGTDLTLSLPITQEEASLIHIASFTQARARLPSVPENATATFQISPGNQTVILESTLDPFPVLNRSEIAFFPYQTNLILNHQEQRFRIDDTRLFLEIPLNPERQGTIESFDGVLTIQTPTFFDTQRQGFRLTPLFQESAESTIPSTPLALIFLFSLLGGLLLNLMPCVFPVLFLKGFDLIKETTHQKRNRLRGLVFTAGAMTTFTALGAAMMVVQATIGQIGWGFQLQNPSVVLALSLLFFVLGLSFSGVWTLGESLMGLGSTQVTRASGYPATFLTGVLAVIVASPCSLPFMATAIGVALVQPPWIGLMVFLVLGFGMSLPYLLLSFFSRWSRFLPKPGQWMITLKQGLAFPLYATCAWLLWVLTRQVGSTGLAIGLASLVWIGGVLWLFSLSDGVWKRASAVAAFLGGLLAVLSLSSPSSPDALAYRPYSQERLETLTSQGKTVFVNFTASWCLTCLVNETLVLKTPEVYSAFQSKDIVPLKADWTTYDPRITQALHALGRNGVPLYVFYSAASRPVILPEILSKPVLLETLASF